MSSRYALPIELSDSRVISGFTEHINRLNEEKAYLKAQNESVSEEYRDALALLNSELQKYAMQVNQLTKEKHEREAEVKKYVETKKRELEVIYEMDELNKENQDLRNKSEKSISNLKNEVSDLEEQLKALRRTDSDHTNTILQMKAENTRLQSQISQLQSQKTQLQSQNTQLLAQNVKLLEGFNKKCDELKVAQVEVDRVASANASVVTSSVHRSSSNNNITTNNNNNNINNSSSNNINTNTLSRKKSTESMQSSLTGNSYRSHRTEAEDLRDALLLSQQEAEHKTNMYESLTSEDSIKLSEYENRGYTRSQAALMIFESKYGKPQPNSTMLRTSSAKENRVTRDQHPPIHRTMSADNVDYKNFEELRRQQTQVVQGNQQVQLRPGSPMYQRPLQSAYSNSRSQSVSPPRDRSSNAEAPNAPGRPSSVILRSSREENPAMSQSSRPASTSMMPVNSSHSSYNYIHTNNNSNYSSSSNSDGVRRASFNATAPSELTMANLRMNPMVTGNTVTARQLQEYYKVGY